MQKHPLPLSHMDFSASLHQEVPHFKSIKYHIEIIKAIGKNFLPRRGKKEERKRGSGEKQKRATGEHGLTRSVHVIIIGNIGKHLKKRDQNKSGYFVEFILFKSKHRPKKIVKLEGVWEGLGSCFFVYYLKGMDLEFKACILPVNMQNLSMISIRSFNNFFGRLKPPISRLKNIRAEHPGDKKNKEKTISA